MEGVARPSLAAIFRRFYARFRRKHEVSAEQRKAAWCIAACRTPALGAEVYRCGKCGKEHRVFHSCRNRNCPRCQAAKSYAWLEEQEGRLLPVKYFHVVFSVPAELNPIIAYNAPLLYGELFRASAETLREFAANPKWLGARMGWVGILHTWGQQLAFHPHVHYLVPQGGMDGPGCWVGPRRELNGKFLFPIVAVSAVFRGKLLSRLEGLAKAKRLRFPDVLSECAFGDSLRIAASKKWEVYAKKPFGGPEAVLWYLGLYTHRVAISQGRLLEMDGQRVKIAYKDYRQGGVAREMWLRGEELVGRFLRHVLPKGFRRIRYYGWLAHWAGREQLARVQAAWLRRMGLLAAVLAQWAQGCGKATPETLPGVKCPRCGEGMMEWVRAEAHDPSVMAGWDSS